MLSKPFRGMTRSRLLILLVLLLALEAAGGAGLYLNNRPAAAGTVAIVPTATPVGAVPLYVTAMPSLLIAGKPAAFASRLPGLANKPVTYQIVYSDGKHQTVHTICDVSGYSSGNFTLRFAPEKRRETIIVRVLDGKKLLISTDFDVLLPAKA